MGIDIDPPPDTGANSFCWPDGETPNTLLLSISGMKRGTQSPLWKFENEPNGVWELERKGANAWGTSSENFDLDYSTRRPGSLVLAVIEATEWSFIGESTSNCIFTFDNVSGTGPTDIWYGGRAQITWR